MPASEVMHLYRQHKLHSGPGGPVVKTKKQATAIQISMARKEGHDIPEKKSFQHGGIVPGYEQPQPPKKQTWLYGREPVRLEDTGIRAQEAAPELVIKSAPTMHQTWPEHEALSRHGGAPVPPARRYEEAARPSAQAQDIAGRTRAAQEEAYQAAMHQRHAPGEATTVPGKNDPVYAIRGLQGNVAQRMHEQGERGSFHGGGRAGSGRYLVHQGEMVTDSTGGRNPGRALVPEKSFDEGGQAGGGGQGATGGSADTGGGGDTPMPDAYRASAPAATVKIQDTGPKKQKTFGEDVPNPFLEAARSAVAAPLSRSSADFDKPAASFKHGGTIPRTGIYRLHAGEHVIPASLAARYRQMKEQHG